MDRKIFRSLALACLVLTAATAALADEPVIIEKEEFKFVLAGGGDTEVIHLEGEELEVGESRQFFTDSGKEIVITRTEDGYDVTIDGEAIDIGETHTKILHLTGHGDATIDIEDGGHKMIFVKAGDGEVETEHKMVWVGSGDAEAHAYTLGDEESAVEHLLASGALDSLDEAQRQKILDALGNFEGSAKVIKVHVEKEEEQH